MKEFNKLVVRVLKIDPEAAIYLASKKTREEKKKITWDRCGRLTSLFAWIDSPQGYYYWDKINNKLCEKYPEYQE